MITQALRVHNAPGGKEGLLIRAPAWARATVALEL